MAFALSKARRRALRDDGWTRRDIEDLEARLGEVEDEDDDDKRSRSSRRSDDDQDDDERSSRRSSNGGAGRVSVFEGPAAERVLARLGLDDEGDEDSDEDEDREERRTRKPKAKATRRGYFE